MVRKFIGSDAIVTRPRWTDAEREAVREFLGEAQPNNATTLVANIEDIMPVAYRRGFEALFARLRLVPHGRTPLTGEAPND